MRTVLLAAALLACVACDDDPEPAADAGTEDSGTDAMVDSGPSGPLVTNAGAPCEGDSDCEGAAASCLMEFDAVAGASMPAGDGEQPAGVEFPGGYCSATCAEHDECGDQAGCAGKDLTDMLSALLETFGGTMGIPAGVGAPDGAANMMMTCLERCVSQSNCREGYICDDIGNALGIVDQLMMFSMGLPIPLLLPDYCLPEDIMMSVNPPDMDGGMPTDATTDEDAAADDAGDAG